MKIFETIRNNLVTFGFNSHESHLFNGKIAIGILLFGLTLLSNVVFISSIDDVILMDYVNSFSLISTLAELGICSATIGLQQTELFELIERLEVPINRSNSNIHFLETFDWFIKNLGLKYETSNAIHEGTNRQIEKISGILYIGLVKVLPQCIIWPVFLISFVKYFATDLNADAFELPLAWWWVAFFQTISWNFSIIEHRFLYNNTNEGYHSIGVAQSDIWLRWLCNGWHLPIYVF